MACNSREEEGASCSADAHKSSKFDLADSGTEWRSWEQLEASPPSTSPAWNSEENEDSGSCVPGTRPSDLFGKFTWKIENFSQISKRELRSNVFEVGGYKWYILVYPQGCDVCNHLSLFLCAADYDKLQPGWSHFVQFTIAAVNKDSKKSKYSDTLHRFCKKEHDWGWKKFLELSKVLDGFTVADTLVIKAQVQVIRPPQDSKSNIKKKEKGVHKGQNKLLPKEPQKYKKVNRCFKCGKQGNSYHACSTKATKKGPPQASQHLSPAQKVSKNRPTDSPRRAETFRRNLESHKWYEDLISMMFLGNRRPTKPEYDILDYIAHALELGVQFNGDEYMKLLKSLEKRGADLNENATSQALSYIRYALKIPDDMLLEGYLQKCAVILAFLSSIDVPKNYSRLTSRLTSSSSRSQSNAT